MHYKKGDRVRHPTKDEWGMGVVLEDSAENVRVFFEQSGERTLALKFVKPTVVVGEEARNDFLDNLKIENGKVATRYKSLRASMDFFLQEFPGGFYGERFNFHERSHKEEIRDEVQRQLGSAGMQALLDEGNFREVCARALKLTGVRANAMIFKNEKMALRDGLVDENAAKSFAETLFGVLHGDGDFDKRFSAFANCLEDIGAAKWTTATYFLFFSDPSRHMFIKPTITQNAAEICAFETNYRPDLNALTYRSVMDFAAYLHKQIAMLEPRDMIDVQSFMWCIAPGTYKSGDA